MNKLKADSAIIETSDIIVTMVSPLADSANHVTPPIPGVQPIGAVEDFLKTLPHITPDEDDGFYDAILDLRRNRRAAMQGK